MCAAALAATAGDIEHGCRDGRLPDTATMATLHAAARAAHQAVDEAVQALVGS